MLSVVEASKRAAARLCVDENINATNNTLLGVGSGTTIVYVLERVKEIISTNANWTVQCVPTSLQARQLIIDHNLPLVELSDVTPNSIDVAIDGADEVDANGVAIKGGGGCLAQEKVVACDAKKFFIVADYRKKSQTLGSVWKTGFPIEVLPCAHQVVRRQICAMHKRVTANNLMLREGSGKMGPMLTDNHNFILDWSFDDKLQNLSAAFINSDRDETATLNGTDLDVDHWSTIADSIKLIPGVVETGLFANYAHKIYFGGQTSDSASVTTITPSMHHLSPSKFYTKTKFFNNQIN